MSADASIHGFIRHFPSPRCPKCEGPLNLTGTAFWPATKKRGGAEGQLHFRCAACRADVDLSLGAYAEGDEQRGGGPTGTAFWAWVWVPPRRADQQSAPPP